ncbi:response regulator [Desulfovibrio sp. UCD-KL4C]|uniref:response regulator n=1 Tax=Desulfovibrio sp. UCD-KL4C TaxID=2578120 RepID=UPI0025BE0DBD|nr:response regulator [Desulfovibrio sp. UCD-KL4C]
MNNYHILVVEDSLTQAVKLEYFLFGKGFRVSLASDGEKALTILGDKEIDLVISDVVMPGMDGYELCEKIRSNKQHKTVPVILLTSLSDPGDIVRGLKSGATNFVTKPYDEAFLFSRIESVIKQNSFDSDNVIMQEVDFEFHGEKHSLKADFGQVFHLLLATYENTLLQSRQLDVANQKLIAREEQLSSVLASMSAKIAVIDTDEKLIVANDSWRDLLAPGRSEAEIEGLDFRKAVIASGSLVNELDILFEGVGAVVSGETDRFSLEFAIEGKGNGESFWHMLEVTPMRGRSGGAVASFIDITGRKEMERELIKARDAAEEASRFKSRFLASMSHEIRTPLNGIVGMTDLTLWPDLTESQAENLEIVRLSADQLLTLINDILDLSKVEARMLKLEIKEFRLHDSLRGIVKSMEPQAFGRGLVLNIDIDEDVPDIVCGDEARLKQILYNLVGNSVKFTEQGGVFVQVSAIDGSDDKENVTLQISVRDTGIGIPDDKQALIFESFRQADNSTTRKFGGSGLGLAISRELVEMMGGVLAVRSSEGYGSVFTFDVVLKRGDPANITLEDSNNGENASENLRKSYRVLVVEDNPINVRVASSLLKKMGHSVYVASNGIDAVRRLSVMNVDLVLMDLEMPEMDGFEAAKHIRSGESGEAKKNIPIIAMSAHAMSGVRERCEQVGMDNYIAKPVQYSDLKEVIFQTVNVESLAPQTPSDDNLCSALDRDKAVKMYHGDEDLYHELCDMFIVEAPQDIKKISEAFTKNDFKTVRRIAHTLKSSCAAICATNAYDVAVKLEKAVLGKDCEAVYNLMEQVLVETEKVRAELMD